MKEFRKSVLGKLTSHRILVSNFGYLSILKVLTFLIPLITLPYLLKVLGKETYGLIVFAQVIASYFLIVVEFGFTLTSAKEVSVHRHDEQKISEIVSSTYILKGGLLLLSMIVLPLILSMIPQADGHYLLFFLTMHYCLYDWMLPTWYFQGMERMKYITIINLLSRIVFLSLSIFI